MNLSKGKEEKKEDSCLNESWEEKKEDVIVG